MRRAISVPILMVAFGSGSFFAARAQTPPPPVSPTATTAADEFQALAEANSLDRKGLAPWHLKMSFTIYDPEGQNGQPGTIEEWWVSPEQRRVVITSGAYSETTPDPQGPPPSSANRLSFLANELLEDVENPIPAAKFVKSESVSQRVRTFGKVQLTCYEIGPATSGLQSTADQHFCAVPGTTYLLAGFDTLRTLVRHRAATFQGVHVAMEDTLAYSGRTVISGQIEDLSTFDPKTFTGAFTHPLPAEHDQPGTVTAGRKIDGDQPVYPVLAKVDNLGGTVVLRGVIGKTGRIESLDVISSPGQSLSDSAVQAVKTWKYKPYLLNGNPTDVETTIVINFGLHP